MKEQNNKDSRWGAGDVSNVKPFGHTVVGGNKFPLVLGENPHSRQENNIYIRTKSGEAIGFDGHRQPIRIEIQEYNYLKESHISGNEVRKGCSVKVYIDDIQVLDQFCRGYQHGYTLATRFINDIEMMRHWFPKDAKSEIGRLVGYRGQICKISGFVISQGCALLERADGQPFDRLVSESEDEYDEETEIKTSITSPHIDWHPIVK